MKKLKDMTIIEIFQMLDSNFGLSARARGYLDAIIHGGFDKSRGWLGHDGTAQYKHELEQEYIQGWREACADFDIDNDE